MRAFAYAFFRSLSWPVYIRRHAYRIALKIKLFLTACVVARSTGFEQKRPRQACPCLDCERLYSQNSLLFSGKPSRAASTEEKRLSGRIFEIGEVLRRRAEFQRPVVQFQHLGEGGGLPSGLP